MGRRGRQVQRRLRKTRGRRKGRRYAALDRQYVGQRPGFWHDVALAVLNRPVAHVVLPVGRTGGYGDTQSRVLMTHPVDAAGRPVLPRMFGSAGEGYLVKPGFEFPPARFDGRWAPDVADRSHDAVSPRPVWLVRGVRRQYARRDRTWGDAGRSIGQRVAGFMSRRGRGGRYSRLSPPYLFTQMGFGLDSSTARAWRDHVDQDLEARGAATGAHYDDGFAPKWLHDGVGEGEGYATRAGYVEHADTVPYTEQWLRRANGEAEIFGTGGRIVSADDLTRAANGTYYLSPSADVEKPYGYVWGDPSGSATAVNRTSYTVPEEFGTPPAVIMDGSYSMTDLARGAANRFDPPPPPAVSS